MYIGDISKTAGWLKLPKATVIQVWLPSLLAGRVPDIWSAYGRRVGCEQILAREWLSAEEPAIFDAVRLRCAMLFVCLLRLLIVAAIAIFDRPCCGPRLRPSVWT
jgi:hypothetical protein